MRESRTKEEGGGKAAAKTRVKWSPGEEAEVEHLFKECIKSKKRPEARDIREALKKSKARNGRIANRSQSQLKNKVFRIIDNLNKK